MGDQPGDPGRPRPNDACNSLWLKRRPAPALRVGILGRIQFDPHEGIQCPLNSG